ncbi:Acg family FMN-binding oxidoreductase [Amycolatopsis sp. MEPSY49]|uniref:Acg family FMN-binding oxidoreductase n=1 Tax=Amycolatopsis sp. MEPSY49 TaxID=3151600 RepID=UPI003EF90788
MDPTMPDAYTVRAAVALAVRAPSLHNSQPWLWRFDGRAVELRADPGRRLRHTDPDGRDLLISCGCALHHFTVAAAAMGWAAQIHRLPEPGVLARIDLVPHETLDHDIALAAAIPQRRSDRRRFAERPFSVRDEVLLQKSAADQGAALYVVKAAPHRTVLTAAAAEAAGLHRADQDYEIELAAWSGRGHAPDGVPARNAVLAIAPRRELRIREFAGARIPDTAGPDGAVLTVLATTGDTPLDRLRAGEAASAVLLTATRLNLASCVYTEPFELTSTRGLVRDCVLNGRLEPQLVVRVGYAPKDSAALPATPRRPIGEVLQPLPHPYGVGLPIPEQLRGR